MPAPARYPELFLAPEERTPESFWISLRYFNLYRVALAGLFFSLSLVYGDALNFGAHSLYLFRLVSAGYMVAGIVFHTGLRRWPDYFNLQLTLHACTDIVAIALLMYASGGIRSGLGVMLLISLTGAAIVAPRRLSFLYAALAAIALLLEHGYWVLWHDAPSATFIQPGCWRWAASPPSGSPDGSRSASPPTRRWRASAAGRSLHRRASTSW